MWLERATEDKTTREKRLRERDWALGEEGGWGGSWVFGEE